MKACLSLLLFFICSVGIAQRVPIEGKINVPLGEEPEGIAVINSSATRATVADSEGEFSILAQVGDTLNFQSLQFQDFSVIIDQGVINERKLTVFISEAITPLAEVIVSPYDLSGNVRVDVQKVELVPVDLPTKTATEINPYEWEFRPDAQTSPENAAMRTAMIYSGANFANIFRSIFKESDILTNVGKKEELEEKVLLLYDDDFFEEHLNIKEENIYDFLHFAQNNGLTSEMLEEENELELLEFLIAQGQRFKQLKAD